MSVRRSLNARQHAIPAEVTWIEFPRTDGDPKSWPKSTTEVIGKDGQVNFMRPMGLDESTGVLWRKVVGKYVAQKLGEPVGKEYVLRSWPTGYQLFDHNKGAAKAPRHDPYLYGSAHVLRFRSANEFAPHAAWLVTDPTLNRANCECKYCAKKPQREITQQLGLPSKRASDSPAPLSGRREKRPRESHKTPHAALRRAPKPAKPRLTGPQQWMVPEKTTDVRDALGRHEGKAIRYFRKGELVWCSISPAIFIPGNEYGIAFWPGLVDVCTTVSEVISRVEPGADMDAAAPASRSQSPTSPAHPPEITWTVQQHVSYKIKLLATSSSILLSEDEVLPYLAYAPSDQILNVLRAELPHALETPAVSELDEQEQKMFAYDPCAPDDEAVRFKQAIAPYTLAIQIASKMATYWTPTDEWECKFTVPSSPPKLPAPSSQSTEPQPSLHNVLNSVMTQNSQVLGSSASASQAAPGVDSRILGDMHRAASVPQVVTQMRYQGLWWGGERIWTDELVRLKLARCQFVPQGNDVVQTPAGSGERTKAYNAERGDEMDDKMSGAGEKGLFMLLEGLFVVEVAHPENGALIKECRASGMLYELVDEDWKPPAAGAEENDETRRADTPAAPDALSNDVANEVPMSASASGPFTTQSPVDALPMGGSISAPPAVPPPTSSQDDGLNAQLSHPVAGSTYPLPHAPKGFKFRPILAKGHEVVLSLSLISGRYYPRLMEHPLLRPTVEQSFATAHENEDALYMLRHLIALEGLLAGVHQSMEPKIWRNGRHIMFKEATLQAKNEFKVRQEELKNAVEVPSDVTMGEATVIDDNSMIDPALLDAPAVVPVA